MTKNTQEGDIHQQTLLRAAGRGGRGTGSEVGALHSPVNHRAVLGGLAGQLLGVEAQKRVRRSKLKKPVTGSRQVGWNRKIPGRENKKIHRAIG